MLFRSQYQYRKKFHVLASPRARIEGSLALLRPDNALFLLLHRAKALEDEFLHPLSFVGFGGVEVALRIRGNAVDGVELAGLAASVAEIGEFFQGIAEQNVNAVIGAVSQKHELLVGVFGKRDVEYGAVTERVLFDEGFFDERAVLLEHLNAVVGAITNVEQAVVCEFGAVDGVAELLYSEDSGSGARTRSHLAELA